MLGWVSRVEIRLFIGHYKDWDNCSLQQKWEFEILSDIYKTSLKVNFKDDLLKRYKSLILETILKNIIKKYH